MVEFDDVLAGRVGDAERDAIRAVGCVVLRGTFDPAEAEAWNAELGKYLDDNVFQDRFLAEHPGAGDRSRIWPVYWSRPRWRHASTTDGRRPPLPQRALDVRVRR